MRYRLRTLLILLAVGPIFLAVFLSQQWGQESNPVLFGAMMYCLTAAGLYWLWR
jgi:hypothetical protein